MATTFVDYTGDGNATKAFSFPSYQESDIKVEVDNVIKTTSTHYNITSYTTTGGGNVVFTSGNIPTSPSAIRIYRDTDVDSAKATYAAGSSVKAGDLNNNQTQLLYGIQEEKNQTIVAADIKDGVITSAKITDGTIATADIADSAITTAKINADAITGAKIADDAIDSEHYTDGSIDTAHIADLNVTTAKIAADAITGAKIADDAIDSEHYTDGSIDTAHIADLNVTTAKIAADAITGAKIADDAIDSEHYADGSIDTAHIADDQVTAAKLANTAVTAGSYTATDITVDAQGRITSASSGTIATSEIAADAITGAKIADDAIDSEHYVDGSIDTAHIAASQVTGAKIAGTTIEASNLASNAVTTAKITDANVTTDKLAADSVTIAKIGCEQTTISDSDSHIPTSGAVVDYVAAQLAPIGGLEVIATEVAFPATASQPPAGVVISIADAGGVVFNGSGVSTTGRTTDGTPATVTINGAPSSLYSETLASGVGMQVSSTGSSNTYNYHKILATESDVKQLSDDINDFNARYRIASSEPGSSNDEGDLLFDTTANKMKVYDGSSWGEVTSTGDFKFLVPVDAGTTTAATWDGSDTSFDLKEGTNSGSAASVTSVFQLIVSLNGVIQKPNAGSWSGSGEGFYLTDADTIRFATAPPSGSTAFIIQCGSAVSIPTPGDGTVSAAKIASGAVATAKIADGAVTTVKLGADAVTGAKIADDAIDSEHYTDGSVDHAHLAADCVDGDNIQDDVINSEHIAAGAVDLEHMSSQSVDEDNLYIDNAGSNGQVLTKQSGGTGGLLWADASGGGAVGGGSDKIFMENGQTVTTNYTIGTEFGAACNALSAGPITINSGITVTIDSGDNWTIV